MNIALNTCPPPKFKRKAPKRVNAGKFSENTKTRIGERDDWKCVRCKSAYIESVPHHIIYKSAMGKGTEDNGCCICRSCHDWAHGKCDGPEGEPAKDGRGWFEDYRDRHFQYKRELVEK